MSYEVTVPPTSEPLTASEISPDGGLHIDTAEQQAYIDLLIRAARQWLERTHDRAIVTQTIVEKLDCWPSGSTIELTIGPVASVTSVQYYDEDDNLQTLSSSDYYFSKARLVSRIVLDEDASWPDLKNRPDAVQITYIAGEATVPQNIVEGIRLAVLGVYLTESESEGEVTESFETSGNFQRLIGNEALELFFMPERRILV